MGNTYDVTVKAPPREGFTGYWSAQRHFPGGQNTKLTVGAQELKELLEDEKHGRLLVEGADELRSQLEANGEGGPSSGASSTPGLSPDEQAALEQYRRSKGAVVDTAAIQAQAKADADAKASADTRAKADADAKAKAEQDAAAAAATKGKGK